MPKPKKALTPSQKYAKDAAAAIRGSRRRGQIPKEELREMVKRHKAMRDKFKSVESLTAKKDL